MNAPVSRRRGPAARRTAPAALVCALGLTLVAGCGGDSSGAAPADGSQSPVPTRDVVSSVRAVPALAGALPADVRERGTLTLGAPLVNGSTGLPLEGRDKDGRTIGIAADIREAVAKVLGVTWKVRTGTFATIIPGVQNGKYDVGMGNFGVTRAREKVVDFATYLNDGQSFLGAENAPVDRVRRLTDLCGLHVSASPGSTFQQILEDGAADCARAGRKPYKVQYFSEQGPVFLGLANGKIDVSFGPTLGVKYQAAHIPHTKYLGEISTTPVGFVTRRGTRLAKALSAAVNKLIDDGTYADILRKWSLPDSGVDASRVNPPPTL
ncbi:ABC transporter substrate-binding protein [Streptomyces sp. NPDC050560]|uniref:ABC transporter substrate-binding protein n=1 Tax=Streptomyces sp. NPDC050560 TaxID=3365630 RepID=UPI0037ACFAED